MREDRRMTDGEKRAVILAALTEHKQITIDGWTGQQTWDVVRKLHDEGVVTLRERVASQYTGVEVELVDKAST
jgi:hypothetical protein